MSFQPVIAGTGITAWAFLQRTYDSQYAAFTGTGTARRDADYFSENISAVKTAEDLVSDRRLLQVALDAFGLGDDLNNRYFLQRVLEDGTSADDALANRLADDRYRKFSEAFGFGPGSAPRTSEPGFAADMLERAEAQRFEIAIGAQDETLRIALNAMRELPEIAGGEQSETAKWFAVMGQPPLRSLFETALGLPPEFGQIDIDKQQSILRDKAVSAFGTSDLSQFSTPEAQEALITRYLARAQISGLGAGNSSAANALALLQG